eukprot:s3435_g5.t2
MRLSFIFEDFFRDRLPRRLLVAMPTVASSPHLQALFPLQEDLDDISNLSDVASVVSHMAGSYIGSVSQFSDTKGSVSVLSSKQMSAFTAPPRYRNSGAFVHGTKFLHFGPIMEQGLKAAKSEIFMIDEVRPDGRVPGLKEAPEILIFIDEVKARSENMEFDYDAKEGTWKTRGIDGVIRPWFFQKVVDQRAGPGRGNVLFQSKEDPLMQANKVPKVVRPKFLLHATYWENVDGILREGIVPAKNPLSNSRRPFKNLLQGAESHIYTLRGGQSAPKFREDALQEQEPKGQAQASTFLVDEDRAGLDRRPDAIFVIDTKKAMDLGIDLELVQSSDREDNIYVRGSVPAEILSSCQPNIPANLPDTLKAKIVDPKSFEDVPIIDLSGDEAGLVEQIRYACEVVGFMQITGHGISEELQAKHMDLQKKFFELPQSVKERLQLCDESPVRGYFGLGGEDLDQVLEKQVDEANGKDTIRKARKDLKEALDCNGVPFARPVGGYIAEIFAQPSQLPAEELLLAAVELAGFREVLDEYASEMFRLSKRLLALMALALDKPRDFFEQHLTQPVATHRLLHYWPLKDYETEIGVGEHTDYGLLTVLKQDLVGGLQVLNAKDGRWIHCCPVKNAFVINLGDMLSRWTAHRFKSTVHRVVTTSASERYSVPYFLEPNMDTIIQFGGLCDGPGTQASGASSSEAPPSSGLFSPPPREAAAQDTAEAILERFYRASGQLKARPRGSNGAEKAR